MALKKKPQQDPLKKLWLRLPPYIRNRYFLSLVAFTILIVFIDRHDVLTQFKLNSTVDRLEEDMDRYDVMIDAAEAEKMDMEQNSERFARESYFMQKDDEDVFIIVEEGKEE
ncbi:MAG: cell division protein FtsB [Neolewinella sp.]|jgi:cell division protein DivIC